MEVGRKNSSQIDRWVPRTLSFLLFIPCQSRKCPTTNLQGLLLQRSSEHGGSHHATRATAGYVPLIVRSQMAAPATFLASWLVLNDPTTPLRCWELGVSCG